MMADVRECVQLQLSEIEMLQSMFPNSWELEIEEETIEKINDFLNETTDEALIERTKFSVNLDFNDKGKISTHAELPILYPVEAPSIYVRSNELSRDNQTKLNSQLSSFLSSFSSGDLIVGSAVNWLQENAAKFFTASHQNSKTLKKDVAGTSSLDGVSLRRLWIYSHHIYSKVKRKDIKDLSVEFNVTGFCLPGKPGLMCVEGYANNVQDWWQTVRSWNWQKIVCKKQEDETDKNLENFRRFKNFEELSSNSNIRVKSGGFHVDMGDLFRYLEAHESGYMFEEFFGVAGK